MELTKSQTKRINKFVKFLSKCNNNKLSIDKYSWIYNIRDNKLWYNNIIIMCEVNDEVLLKLSKGYWFNTINNYFGKIKIKEFEKECDKWWDLKFEQIKTNKAEKIALIIEQETNHNKRVELIKELLER